MVDLLRNMFLSDSDEDNLLENEEPDDSSKYNISSKNMYSNNL